MNSAERKREELTTAIFSDLGQKLSWTRTANEAARVIVDAAQDLFGWDACSVDLYSVERNSNSPVLTLDTVDGRIRPVAPAYVHSSPSSFSIRVLNEGPKLILRQNGTEMQDELLPFGDPTRRSASLMFVPIRHRGEAVGVLSIQSYSSDAYSQKDLKTLQALADHCGGALERLRAEETLRQTEKRFRLLFETAPFGIAITRHGRLIQANPAYLRIFGHAPETAPPGCSVLDHLSPGSREKVQNYIAKREAGERVPENYDVVGLRRDGTEFPFHLEIARIELPDGQATVAFVADLTERLNLESQLRQSQRMESIGQLAAGIAHEFNNALTVILGYASALQTKPVFQNEDYEALQHITSAGERAASLVKQLLAFSRKQVVRAQPVRLNQLVDRTASLFSRVLGEQITVRVNCGDDLPLISADPSMLDQVLMNLALQARDSMTSGGTLRITTSSVRIDESYLAHCAEAEPGLHVCLAVSDTGPGLPPDQAAHIFDPFFTTKHFGQGSGLRMASVYGIVKQHRGWIEVETQPGAGCEFRVFLPAAEQSTIVAPGSKKNQQGGGKATILLVEDEGMLLDLAESILVHQGYKVLSAPNGPKALEVWTQHSSEIDLLLTDVVMPEGMNGRELAELLLAERPDLKVIYTTGYGQDVLGPNFLLKEGINYLAKPYRPKELLGIVLSILDGHRSTVAPNDSLA